ncbi:MAG: prephenate dehydratase domain-containing protein, partial [Myxococcales bacterium]
MDPRRSTPELRTEIARLDREILERLEARARASKEIRARAESEPAPDTTDRDALALLNAAASGDLPSEALYAIFSAIRASARALEQAPRVAYLGPEGGFCHVLGRAHFGAGGSFIECPSVREALEEVARGRAACAIFPFESSADGLVQASITALTDTELVIVGARTLPMTFQLMGKGSALSDLEKVYTTPAGHAACQRFLDSELPRVSVIDVRSMKVAAELAQEDPTSAALLPEPTGREQGLGMLRENVGDVA